MKKICNAFRISRQNRRIIYQEPRLAYSGVIGERYVPASTRIVSRRRRMCVLFPSSVTNAALRVSIRYYDCAVDYRVCRHDLKRRRRNACACRAARTVRSNGRVRGRVRAQVKRRKSCISFRFIYFVRRLAQVRLHLRDSG